MGNILANLGQPQVHWADGVPAPHKPLLLLYALGRMTGSAERLVPFREVDGELQDLLKRFAPSSSERLNTHYPFGRLEADEFWEVEQSETLRRTAVGHLLKSELIERNIHASFTKQVFATLQRDPTLRYRIAGNLIDQYLPACDKTELLATVGLEASQSAATAGNLSSKQEPETSAEPFASTEDANRVLEMTRNENAFIGYLNSLHSLGADGSNSLAESQAMSPFFGELYEPLSMVDPLKRLLSAEQDRVVILTGHAGDGKSTVALDVYKALRALPAAQPLPAPLREREDVPTPTGVVTVVKDMSELSGDDRKERLRQAFDEAGSWLIVSNTGPLLNSMIEYAEEHDLPNMESRILTQLDRPVRTSALEEDPLSGFGKPLLIFNLTRLENVALGARLLVKLLQHSGWKQCDGCDIQPACPLALNRRALLDSIGVVEERVRWLYRRINDYEQRLTLRQIVGHLSYSLTGGIGCAEARSSVESATGSGSAQGTAGLRKIVFSERFFGCEDGRPDPNGEAFKAIRLLRRADIGGPVAPDIERAFAGPVGRGWVELPDALTHLATHWAARAAESQGWPARAALRRQALIYGNPPRDRRQQAEVFLDAMLRSPSVRQVDAWQQAGRMTLSRSEQKRLRVQCLNVLLEAFSGFAAEQYVGDQDKLYLTLRRPDRSIMQASQLVTASFSFRDFQLEYNHEHGLPVLSHRNVEISLHLPLPLLDYIARRAEGQLNSFLSPIHQLQLDRFQAQLGRFHLEQSDDSDEIAILRAGIDGSVDEIINYVDDSEHVLGRI